LWEQWNDIESCTILTMAANQLMLPVHDRMPVILSPNDYDAWLEPKLDDLKRLNCLFEPFPDSELIAYHVNPVVNNARHDAADCIESTEKHSTKYIQVKWKPWGTRNPRKVMPAWDLQNPPPLCGNSGLIYFV
jgi:hypothetical protein